MPYADPEKRRANSKRWRELKREQGYHKALYARRAQRYRNEETLRLAVEKAIASLEHGKAGAALLTLKKALKAAPPPGPPMDYLP